MWPFHVGLLLESETNVILSPAPSHGNDSRSISAPPPPQTMFFSLSHPLDQLQPILPATADDTLVNGDRSWQVLLSLPNLNLLTLVDPRTRCVLLVQIFAQPPVEKTYASAKQRALSDDLSDAGSLSVHCDYLLSTLLESELSNPSTDRTPAIADDLSSFIAHDKCDNVMVCVLSKWTGMLHTYLLEEGAATTSGARKATLSARPYFRLKVRDAVPVCASRRPALVREKKRGKKESMRSVTVSLNDRSMER
jgi:hypothetical protein